MKKTYIAPYVEKVNVEVVSILAQSFNLEDDVVNSNEQQGRDFEYDDRIFSPNLWEKGW